MGEPTALRRARAAGTLCAALLLAGCAADSAVHSHPAPPAPVAGPAATVAPPPAPVAVEQDSYLQSLYADSRLDPIRDKVPLLLRPGAIKPNYLTNENKPVFPEKQAIQVWLQVRERAQQYQTAKSGEPSPELAQTRKQVTMAIYQLQAGKMTYAAFARRIQQIDEDHQAAMRQDVGLHN